jgi:poly(beta-D-mannuronate) lyase
VRARNCVIAHNTVINSAGPYLLLSAGLGNSPRRTLRPEHITLANNVFLVPLGVELLGGTEGRDYRWTGNFVEGAESVDESKIKRVELRLTKDADGIWRPGPDSPLRNAAVSANAASLVVPEAAALFETDIDGQPRRAPADAGCDELSDEPILNRPLTKRDVGPSWMLGIAGRETKAKALR